MLQALENATKLTVVVFDKTGTLTLGQPEVVEIATKDGRHGTRSAQVRRGGREELRASPRPGDHWRAQGRRRPRLRPSSPISMARAPRHWWTARNVLLGNRKLMDASAVALGDLAEASGSPAERRPHGRLRCRRPRTASGSSPSPMRPGQPRKPQPWRNCRTRGVKGRNADRRQPAPRRSASPANSASTSYSLTSCLGRKRPRSRNCRAKATRLGWSGTV